MLLLTYIFVLLHVITGAAWFGMGLNLSSQARLAERVGKSGIDSVHAETQKSIGLMGIFIVLTFVFGLVAFFAGGGFAVYGAEFHTSILLVLILIAVHYLLIRPSWNRFGSALASDNAQDATTQRKRLGMFMGIGHLIWVVVLFLMFWKYFRPALAML